MPRLLGVDIPGDKRIEASLPYIYGIGLSSTDCDSVACCPVVPASMRLLATSTCTGSWSSVAGCLLSKRRAHRVRGGVSQSGV